MKKGLALLIKISEGVASSNIQCNKASPEEIGLAISHLELSKIKLLEMFNNLSKKI